MPMTPRSRTGVVRGLLVASGGLAALQAACARAPRVEPIAPGAAAQAPPPAPPAIGPEPQAYENRLLSNLSRHTFTENGRDFDPDIDATGEWLVFASTRNARQPDIYLKRADGFAVTQLTSDAVADVQPRFSPDGQRVAFASNRAGNWDIWLVGRDGTRLTRLTDDSVDEVAPAWSPDGAQLAFTQWGQRSEQWEIWTVSADAPGTRRFLAYGMFPCWSPDGARIAFQRARERGSRWFSVWHVSLVDGEARHPTEVAHSENGACIAPRFSPDGQSLVYGEVRAVEGDATGQRYSGALWQVDIERGVRKRVTDGAQPAYNPVWGPQGRIYFVTAQAGAENIWSVSAAAVSAVAGETVEGPPARPSADPIPEAD